MRTVAAGPLRTDTGAGELANRSNALYLLRRRQELLAPLRALIELTTILATDEALERSADVHSDLLAVRRTAREMSGRVRREFNPRGADLGILHKLVDHDLRNKLAIIIGYADELCSNAPIDQLESFRPAFDEVRRFGHRILSLVERTALQLQAVEGDGPIIDDVQPYLDRLVIGDFDPGPALEASPKPGRILIAEDNEVVRSMIGKHLKGMGHAVVTVGNGREADSKLRNQIFDLVLTDIDMPVTNGFELIAAIKANDRLRDLPVIVLSGHSDLDAVARCITLGAEDYLPKPFNTAILRARVETCLNKKRLLDQSKQERRRHKELLYSIMPGPIVEELSRTDTVCPINRDGVAVLFADIVGFTTYCDLHQDRPDLVLDQLRRLFESWEQASANLKVQKIKTIGDAFMGAAGLLEEADNPVLDCVRLGIEMIRRTRELADDQGRRLGFDLRVGVHLGPVVAGVLGRSQALFDLWGDTVNVAARLESHGVAGAVNLSDTAWSFVEQQIVGESRSTRLLKGKAEPTEIIHLDPDQIKISLM